jgi:hypothetical protein
MSILSYEEVLKHLKSQKRDKHLLIGNGFSMAYAPDIFSYNALSRFVEDSKNELLGELFSVIKSRNFEQIMQQLSISKEIVLAFSGDRTLIDKISSASSNLKGALIEAVEKLHPEHVFKIPEAKSIACSKFLREYLDSSGNIFSTNYDILLYWVLMRNSVPNAIDSFGRDVEDQGEYVPEDEVVLSELRWGNHKNKQNVHYLHGALQIFDDGVEIVKEQYNGNFILENIKKRMDNGNYPIFVTAGDGEEKLNHIMHNHYLAFCYDKLCSIKGSLITFGFNFGDYDEHIIKAINEASMQDIKEKLWRIYIGVYSEDDIMHIESIKKKFKCKVNMFDTKTIKVWG